MKEVAHWIPYINNLAVFWDVRADARSWSLLPGEILIWTGVVPPGEHVITVKFYDSQDYELPRYRQSWYFIPTEMDQETVVVIRAGRNKCNMSGQKKGM